MAGTEKRDEARGFVKYSINCVLAQKAQKEQKEEK